MERIVLFDIRKSHGRKAKAGTLCDGNGDFIVKFRDSGDLDHKQTLASTTQNAYCLILVYLTMEIRVATPVR